MFGLLAWVVVASAGDWTAGASRVDVTPPPTLDTFGHGPNARTSRGHRGRLTCTSIVFERDDEVTALVACDLHSISTRLQQESARHAGISPSRLVLSATHTHGGPAHYFTEEAYSGLLSSDRAGASEAYLQALARQVGAGVREARDDARRNPGPVRIGVDRWEPTEPYAWNRSLEPHCASAPASDRACEQNYRDPARGVDDEITILRVVRDQRTIATHVVLPVHPTTLPNNSDVFHPDLHGLVREALEERPGLEGWFALANGAEGDVSPLVKSQTWTEARHLARRVAEEVVAGWDSLVLEPLQALELRYGRMALPRGDLGGSRNNGVYGQLLCPPQIGNAAASGAEGGLTWLYVLGLSFQEGAITPRAEPLCQNPKRSNLLALMLGPRSFPTQVPVHRLQLNEHVWTTIPGEATTEVGRRVREASAPGEPHNASVIGLAGGYLQYIATLEQFLLQHYEGASTLFGRYQAERFLERVEDLRLGAPTLHQCRVDGALVDAAGGRCPEATWTAGRLRQRGYPATGRIDDTGPSARPDAAVAWLAENDPLEAASSAGLGRWQRAERKRNDGTVPRRIAEADRGCGGSVHHRVRWVGQPGGATPGQAVVLVRDLASRQVLATDLATDVEVRLARPEQFDDVPLFNLSASRNAQWTATWTPVVAQYGARARFELLAPGGQVTAEGPEFEVGTGECEAREAPWLEVGARTAAAP